MSAGTPPTENEMNNFLISSSVNPNCFQPKNHYIDLNVSLHTVVTENLRDLTFLEQQLLSAMIQSIHGLSLLQVNPFSFWFEVSPNATSLDETRGLYVILNYLNSLNKSSTDLYLVSQQTCS